MSDSPYSDIVARVFPNAEIQSVTPLTGGVSADVYRIELNLVDGSSTSLVLRLHGAYHSGHPADLEYRLQRALYQHGESVPEPLLVDVSGDVLGDPFLLMAFVEGTSDIPVAKQIHYLDTMANTLAKIHAVPTTILPTLPVRIDPIPELLDYLPKAQEWQDLRAYLRSLSDTSYLNSPKLLHGDFWPLNLLWQHDAIVAVIDWENAAIGDPLSDVACSLLELRYQFGKKRAQRFAETYAGYRKVDRERLALWQAYVAAAAQRFMGEWRLAPPQEAHMRREALDSIRESAAFLLDHTTN